MANGDGAGGAPSFAPEPEFGEEAARGYRQEYLQNPSIQSVIPGELPFPPDTPLDKSKFAPEEYNLYAPRPYVDPNLDSRTAAVQKNRQTILDAMSRDVSSVPLPRLTPSDTEVEEPLRLQDNVSKIVKQASETARPLDFPGMAAAGARTISGAASMFGVPTVPRAIEEGAAQKAQVDDRIRASTAATFRESGLPGFMAPQYGIYPPNYADMIADAVGSGKITDKQAAAALANFDKFKRNTSLGVAYGKEEFLAEQTANKLENDARRQGFTEEAIAKTNQAYDVAEQKLAESKQQYEQRRAQFEVDLQKRRADMDALDSEIRATKIEPMSYFSKDNVWAGILSALSVAVGAFAQGYSGGKVPNTALQLMNAAIERDLEAQKANLAAKGRALEYKRSLYGMAREALGDDRQAFEYSKGLMYEQLQNAATKIANEARGKEAQLGAMEIANAAGAAKEQARLNTQAMYVQMREAAEDNVRRQQAAHAAWLVGKEERELKRRERLATVNKKEAEAALARSDAGTPLEGGWTMAKKGAEKLYSGRLFAAYDSSGKEIEANPGFMPATTPEVADKVRKQLGSYDKMIGILSKSLQLPEIGAGGKAQLAFTDTPYVSPSESAEYKRLRAEFLSTYKEMNELGALDSGVERVGKDAGPLTAANNREVARKMIQELVQAREKRVTEVGGVPGELGFVQNQPAIKIDLVPSAAKPGVSFTPSKK